MVFSSSCSVHFFKRRRPLLLQFLAPSVPVASFQGVFFLCISVLRVASGPRVKLAGCKSALNPPVVCSTDRSKAVVPVLVLLFVALWFMINGTILILI